MNLPQVTSYGNYRGSNYGAHCLKVSFENLEIYYSYETVVAFWTRETGLIVSENCFSMTTGKHINWINADKSERMKRDEFVKLFIDVLGIYQLA